MATITTYTDNKFAGKNTGNLPYTTTVRIDGSSGTIAASDVVEIVKVPQGAVVTHVSANVVTAEGGVATFDLGDGGSATRYQSNTDANATGATNSTTGLGYVYTADDTIDLTADNEIDTAVIDVTVVYVMNENAD